MSDNTPMRSPPANANTDMPVRRPAVARFTQRDLTRALKAAVQAGLQVAEALVTRDGDIKLLFSAGAAVSKSEPEKALNEWLGKRARAS